MRLVAEAGFKPRADSKACAFTHYPQRRDAEGGTLASSLLHREPFWGSAQVWGHSQALGTSTIELAVWRAIPCVSQATEAERQPGDVSPWSSPEAL